MRADIESAIRKLKTSEYSDENRPLINEVIKDLQAVLDTSFTEIVWRYEDIEEVFRQNGVEEPDEDDIKDFAEYCSQQLQDRSIERGWDTMDTLFSMWNT